MWDLNSLTRDQTHVSCIEKQILNHSTTREVPASSLIGAQYGSLRAFPGGLDGKESACNAGDLGLIPGLERSPGEGKGYPLQCSGLENSIDCIVHGVAKSGTRLSDFHFHFSNAVI